MENEVVDHYALLGVPMGATPREIRDAYEARLEALRQAVKGGNPPPVSVVDRLRQAYKAISAAQAAAQAETQSTASLQGQQTAVESSAEPAAQTVTLTEAARDFVAPLAGNVAEIRPVADSSASMLSKFRFSFVGKGEEYFRIWIVNLFLSIITMGIYAVWAKVRREKYFHNSMQLDGSTFDYHGTPMAIFKGRALAGVLLVALNAAQKVSPMAHVVMMLLLIPIVPWFAVRAFRFRAHNTSYRGIRFAFHGRYREALAAIVGYGLLTLVTFGITYPYWYAKMRLFIMNNIAYGTARLNSPTSAGDISRALYKPMLGASLAFVVMSVVIVMAVGGMGSALHAGVAGEEAASQAMSPMLMVLPVLIGLMWLGMVLFFRGLFAVRVGNLVLEDARVGNLQIHSQLELKPYLGIAVKNLVLILLTLGLYIPFAHIRMAHYRAEAVGFTAEGGLNEFVAGEKTRVAAMGDEASEMFDMDIAL